jgi:hypothetical protein
MSRQLPSRPNLDHLRKQAKVLLATARLQHPSWQLADAQFAVARDYGFASWPALKAHVDAAAEGSCDTPAPRDPVAPADRREDSPLDGVWVASVAESRRHPAFLFESATLEIRVNGARVTMTQAVVDASGQKSGGTMAMDADGRPHAPAGGGSGHTLVAQWLDARTLEAVDSKDGIETGRGRYEVTPDGHQLVVTTAEQRLVFDRR